VVTLECKTPYKSLCDSTGQADSYRRNPIQDTTCLKGNSEGSPNKFKSKNEKVKIQESLILHFEFLIFNLWWPRRDFSLRNERPKALDVLGNTSVLRYQIGAWYSPCLQ
jgi:hypothetical protein